ncbi:MAG: GNAT family N-acetyltransferase [Pseudobdellovibrionaceae bacterium]
MTPALEYSIQELKLSDLPALKEFTDREIGAGYYTLSELEDIYQRSRIWDRMCSLVLKKGEQIEGVRITYPPGHWSHGKGEGLSIEKWPYPLSQTAYFQSLFLSQAVQGQGWGGRLSECSLEILKSVGAKGVVCHSWKESPNNSSGKYLEKLGFQVIKEHPLYWQHVNYICTRCGKPPCQCTAQEMYLKLEAR